MGPPALLRETVSDGASVSGREYCWMCKETTSEGVRVSGRDWGLAVLLRETVSDGASVSGEGVLLDV